MSYYSNQTGYVTQENNMAFLDGRIKEALSSINVKKLTNAKTVECSNCVDGLSGG